MENKKIKYGEVISNKMKKTVVVKTEKKIRHQLYKKFIKKSKKFYVHDENNELNIGDLISFVECAPLSKTKNWRFFRRIESY